MKTYYLTLFVIVFFSFNQSFAQEATKVDSFGLTQETPFLINQFVVIQKDSLSVQDGYDRVLEWVNINYNTPKEVIKSQLEKEYIRIEGVETGIPCITIMLNKSCYDTKHSLTFEFKENKIKFQLTGLQLYSAPNKYAAGGWSDANPDFNFLYKKNGKPRKNQIEFAEGFTSLLNRLQKNFTNYLNNPIKEQKSKSDW